MKYLVLLSLFLVSCNSSEKTIIAICTSLSGEKVIVGPSSSITIERGSNSNFKLKECSVIPTEELILK